MATPLKYRHKGKTDIEATFFISAPYIRLSDLGLIPKTSPHTTKAPPLAPHTPTRPSMRKRSQLVSATTYTPRDATGLEHAKPSHQVQPVHQNQPTTAPTTPHATYPGSYTQNRRANCSRGHKTRRHAPPPTPHATNPGSNTQNCRTRCSWCTKINPTTVPTTPHATKPSPYQHVLPEEVLWVVADVEERVTPGVERLALTGCRYAGVSDEYDVALLLGYEGYRGEWEGV